MNRSKFFAVLAFLFALTAPLAVSVTAAQAQSSSFGDGAAVVFDDEAVNDGVKIDISGVDAAPEGMEYVAWLVTDDSEGFLNLGTLAVENGVVKHAFTSDGDNLIQMYSGWAVTVEEAGAGESLQKPTNQGVVYDRIGAESIAQIRALDAATRQTSAQLALALACARDAKDADAIEDVKSNAQCVVNLLEGAEGDNYDASVGASGGDGMGVLNYVAAMKTAAEDIADRSEERPELGSHGGSAARAAANAETWTTGARDAALNALSKDDLELAKLYIGPGGLSAISQLDAAVNGHDANGDSVLNEGDPSEQGATHVARATQLAATLKTVSGELPVVTTPTPTPAPTATPEPTATPIPTPTPIPQPAGPGLPGVGGMAPSASAMAMLLGVALAVAIGGLTALRANRVKERRETA